MVAGCAVVGWVGHEFGLANPNVLMIFLAGVAFVAARFAHGPAIAAAILSVLIFDFLFVEPTFKFVPSDIQYFVNLGVLLGIAILISELTSRLQSQLRDSQDHEHHTEELFHASQQRERRTAALYQISQQLTRSPGSADLLLTAGEQLSRAFDSEVVIYLCGPDQAFRPCFGQFPSSVNIDNTVKWVAKNRQAAGLDAETSSELTIRFVPMIGSQRTIGVLGVRPNNLQRFRDTEDAACWKPARI